jgi:type I restriction enzyme S subunit
MGNTPNIRFKGFTDDWEQRKLGEILIGLQNNTLSRADLSNETGVAKNVHYGDVLIKFGEVLDVSKEKLPMISDESILSKYKSSFLQNGDVIVADTAEDSTVGKCSEIAGLNDEIVLSGLHTIPYRPIEKFASGYLGYYLNSSAYHNQLIPLMQGIKVTAISKSAMQDTDIVYPKSMEEQGKIGDYFQLLDNLITLHQRKCDETKKLKKFMLQKMFPKKDAKKPEIRFAGFTDDWEQRKLGEICQRVIRKNKNNESDLPLTIASQYGLIDQRDFFNKVVAAKDMSNYYLLRKGEFAYNKSYSNGFEYGSIKRLNAYEQGCLSTLYICFEITSDEVDSDYLECFFDTLKWYGDLSMICAEGARNHGLLNVDIKAFFADINVSTPTNLKEQRKIATYLNNLDHLITLHQRKCDKLKKFKKYMLQNMFPQKG